MPWILQRSIHVEYPIFSNYYHLPPCTEHPATFAKYLLESQRLKVNLNDFWLMYVVSSVVACGIDVPQWNVVSGKRVNESLLWAESFSARHLALLMVDSILLARIRVLSRVRLTSSSCLIISYIANH